jgi:hypothetical protein
MSNVRKMVLIDYAKYNQIQNQPRDLNVNPKPLINLDREIYDILQRNDLSDYEKQKLYSSKLNKYLFFVNQKVNKATPEYRIGVPIKQERLKLEKGNPTIHNRKRKRDPSFSESEFDSDTEKEENIPIPDLDLSGIPIRNTASFYKARTSSPKIFGREYSEESSASSQDEKTLTPKKYVRKKKNTNSRKSPVQLRSSRKDQIGGWISFRNMIKMKF